MIVLNSCLLINQSTLTHLVKDRIVCQLDITHVGTHLEVWAHFSHNPNYSPTLSARVIVYMNRMRCQNIHK